ncbi:septum formation family protein [Ruania zhangjianzhongii]|uniref:septum formation family protein n=1 Tax=Ruania zhangjianzhongii TaxID=2603206 RepID=UPI00143D2748|nr:septum formation family protein [Ruania zhangjianzhongii]
MNTGRIVRTALAVVGAVGVSASLAACGGQVATAEVGSCVNTSDFEGEITEIPTVDCSEEHDAQVFHLFDMDDGDFPGDDAISTAAEEQCLPAFEEFVGADYQESSLDINFIGPSQDTWDQADDREVICVLYTMDGSTSTESFEGSGL